MSKKIWVTLIVVVGILSVLVFNFVYKKTSNSERYQKEIVETLSPKETDAIEVKRENSGNSDEPKGDGKSLDELMGGEPVIVINDTVDSLEETVGNENINFESSESLIENETKDTDWNELSSEEQEERINEAVESLQETEAVSIDTEIFNEIQSKYKEKADQIRNDEELKAAIRKAHGLE